MQLNRVSDVMPWMSIMCHLSAPFKDLQPRQEDFKI